LFEKIKRNSAATRLLEEQLYEQVVCELMRGQRRNGLWAKSLANSDGQEEKAKALYIQYRVQSLKDEAELSREEGVEANSHNQEKNNISSTPDIGFTWWKVWAWLGLTLGNLYTFTLIQELPEFAIGLIIINSILMVMILTYNKYAFLAATILSINPLLWIINGIYLRNRWNHPLINKDSTPASVVTQEHNMHGDWKTTGNGESTLWIHILVWSIAGLILLGYIVQ